MKNIKSTFGLVILSSFAFLSCGSEQTTQEKKLRPLVFQEVGFQNNANKRTFNGTAETDKVINLSFRNNGIIIRFDINVGQRVQKGQLLAELDNVQARLAYEQAVASLNSAESQMNTAKLGYDRVRKLYEKGSASLSDFENAKNSFQTAENSYEGAQRSVEIQKEQINYGFIYAPESGVIANVNAEIDENVGPGQTVAVLNAGDRMTVNLGLPESVINSVRECNEVVIEFPALEGQSFDGQVVEIAPAVNPNTATYPVKIELLNATNEVKSGMAANVTFDFSQDNNQSLIVPAKSVGEDNKGHFVFLVDDSGQTAKVKKHHITIGALNSFGFEVVNGLSVGQKIAVAGLQTLLDGQEVSLQK